MSDPKTPDEQLAPCTFTPVQIVTAMFFLPKAARHFWVPF